MSKNRFKAGDRVRLKKSGTIALVVIAKNGWIAYDENRRIGGACPMEDVESIDRKTDFLTRLSELMREFDVSFIAHKTDMPISAYFKDDEIPFARLGKENNKGCGVVITPDNIMEYDKE
ncbi:hypothetical protein [uncultured Bacteroides sp.]|uniref:hypothetical protein n=1 Tax=uncultured Bacteroides sp. TaxID=162156 RepID=UPI0026288D6D|nr:hypothetical protein [uncultured Bacteroides sp.]